MTETITYSEALAKLDADLERLADDILEEMLRQGLALSEITRARAGIREKLAPMRRQAELNTAAVFSLVETRH